MDISRNYGDLTMKLTLSCLAVNIAENGKSLGKNNRDNVSDKAYVILTNTGIVVPVSLTRQCFYYFTTKQTFMKPHKFKNSIIFMNKTRLKQTFVTRLA